MIQQPSSIVSAPHPPVILVDGLCNLCDAYAQFVIDRDPTGVFVFGSLQSELGRALAAKYGVVVPEEPDGIVLVEAGRIHLRSDAVLRVARRLASPWRWSAALIVIPRYLRDAVYRAVARQRYRWLGKREECRVPTPELRARFLESRPDIIGDMNKGPSERQCPC